MRYYLQVWVILGLTLLVLAFVDYSVWQKGAQVRIKINQTNQDYINDQMVSLAAANQARTAYQQNASARAFIEEWRPVYQEGLSVPDFVTWVSGKSGELAIGFQIVGGTNLRHDYPFQGRDITVQTYGLTMTGDYWRLMNFLAMFEEHFPIARVDKAVFVQDKSLSLTLSISVPQLQLDPPVPSF